MEYNKEEARKAMDCAEKKLSENDYFGAKEYVNKARNLYPDLDGFEQMLILVNVFISASKKVIGGEFDWYGILGVGHLADDETVKKQYKRLAFLLHPDKNRFNGAEEAFKLVLNAFHLLSDKAERSAYDRNRKSKEVKEKKKQKKPPKPPSNKAKPQRKPKPKPEPEPEPPKQDETGTFWTMCNECNTCCEYMRANHLNKTLICQKCGKSFVATEIDPEIVNRKRKEEEEKRAAEAAQEQKKAKEKEKKLLRKERNRFRTLSAPVVAQYLLDISEEDIENICMSLNTEQLQKLCDNMENKEGLELAKVIKDVCNSSQNYKEAEESKKTSGAKWTSKVHESEKKQPWSKEEIDMLKKGIVKYPKGTSRRWEVISEYIGTGRTVEEILKTTKTVLLQKPDSDKAFDSFLEKRKPSVPISSPLSTREELGESPLPTTDGKPTSKETVGNNKNGEGDGSSDTDGWSAEQEIALVQALKTFPKETSQRWERVAAAIPGKTMSQCKKKFAELKEIIRSKKTGV